MSIKPIIAVLSIAGTSVVLTGCNPEATKSFDTAMAALNGGPLLGSAPAPLVASVPEAVVETVAVVVSEPVVEPEPPAPVYERVCRIEWHRAGTMQVEVCENRLVST